MECLQLGASMQREPVVAFFEQEFITLGHALED